MSLQGKIYTKYVMALNKIVRAALKPNVEYDNINDIDLTEIKRLKSEYGIGGMIIDVDGTILHELEYIPTSVLKTLKLLNQEFKNLENEIQRRIKNKGKSYLLLSFLKR